MNLFSLQTGIMGLIYLVLVVVNVVALVDAVTRRAEAFEAAGKLTKKGWLLILGLALAMQLLLGGGIGMFVGAIASLVYFLDVRPAVAAMTRRR